MGTVGDNYAFARIRRRPSPPSGPASVAVSAPFLVSIAIGLVAGGSLGFVAMGLAAASRLGTEAVVPATRVALPVEEPGADLAAFPAPRSYGLCFVAGTAFLAVSYLALSRAREPVEATRRAPVPLGAYLRRIPALLRRDRNLAWFLASRAVMTLAAMGSGFYTVYALRAFAAPDWHPANTPVAYDDVAPAGFRSTHDAALSLHTLAWSPPPNRA